MTVLILVCILIVAVIAVVYAATRSENGSKNGYVPNSEAFFRHDTAFSSKYSGHLENDFYSESTCDCCGNTNCMEDLIEAANTSRWKDLDPDSTPVQPDYVSPIFDSTPDNFCSTPDSYTAESYDGVGRYSSDISGGCDIETTSSSD